MKLYARSIIPSIIPSIAVYVSLALAVFATSTCSIAQTKLSVKKSFSTVTKKSNNIQLTLASLEEDSITPDISVSTTNDYRCELNDSLTIYTHEDDDSRATLRWKNRLYALKRVETTTGANRFENKKAGLVWIGIPTKGMLLDSIHGQELTNECKIAD